MTSSTRRSDGPLATLAIVAAAIACIGAAHLAFDAVATYAETRLGASLWKEQDYLRVLSPAYHAGRGRTRLFIYGPSEAREGLLPEEIAPRVPGLVPYQNAQSFGTLDDGLLVLDYLERAYGTDAVPADILVGVTPRFIANIRRQTSPLVEGIRRYSPHFTVPVDGPPRLVERSWAEALWARAKLLRLQPDRYRRGLLAVSRPVFAAVPAATRVIDRATRPAKSLDGRLAPVHDIKAWLRSPESFWHDVYAWEPARDRARIERELAQLRAYADRHGAGLYVVNLPETSWTRELYDDGRYADYMAILRVSLAGTPFLDLRTFLADEEFFDEAHPTSRGGRRLSAEVGAFVQRERVRLETTRRAAR